MLDFEADRIDYGEQLQAPRGFLLDYAVATTYSLDLETLMVIPVALFQNRYLENEYRNTSEEQTPVQLLDAIKKAGSKLRVYCQKGKIKVPSNFYRAFSFLEPCIEQITTKSPHWSFHPKCWLLRFKGEESHKVFYRLIILSRNLTFDQSWDIAYTSEGMVMDHRQGENKDLVSFLRYLSNEGDKTLPEKFIKELEKVRFEVADNYESQEIIPFGFDNEYHSPVKKILEDENSYDSALIISPFWSATLINKIKKKVDGKCYLFGRKEEFDKLPASTFEGCEAYVINPIIFDLADMDMAIDQDGMISENNIAVNERQNLHAKLFVFSKDGKHQWLLGSANATGAATYMNCEILLKLTRDDTGSSPIAIKEELLQDEEKGVFKAYKALEEPSTAIDEADFREVKSWFFNHIEADKDHLKLICHHIIENDYKLEIKLSKLDDFPFNEYELCIGPVHIGNEQCECIKNDSIIHYEPINELHLSRFVKVILTDKKTRSREIFLIKASVQGIPDSRNQRILSYLISNTQRLYKYIVFLMGENESHLWSVVKNNSSTSGSSSDFSFHASIPMMEKLLISASRNQNRLSDIDNLLTQLELDEKSDEFQSFMKFWRPFREIISKQND